MSNCKIDATSSTSVVTLVIQMKVKAHILCSAVRRGVPVRLTVTPHLTLTVTPHLTLKMTAAEAVETSVTTINSPSQDFTNLDDQPSQTLTDTPVFKPFTLSPRPARSAGRGPKARGRGC